MFSILDKLEFVLGDFAQLQAKVHDLSIKTG